MALYVITVVLGIWLTMRKLDVSRRESADFPEVSPERFERWRAAALRAYNLGSLVCFGELLLLIGLELVPRLGIGLALRTVRVIGFASLVAWLGSLILVWVLSARARRLQDEAGIRLLPRVRPRDDGAVSASEEGPDSGRRKEVEP